MPYRVLLSYPVHSSLTAYFSDGSSATLPLTEQGVSNSDVVQPYHAYSPSGTAHAKAVFVNYGREEDYRALGEMGVAVEGCVVVARKGGGLSRGKVVELAETKGASAVLIYAEEDKIKGGGIERGTVMRGVGDPLTPGWAAVDGNESLSLDDNEVLKRFPKIPSMPLSMECAEIILRSLEGPEVPSKWRETLQSSVARVGPGPTVLNFSYQVSMMHR